MLTVILMIITAIGKAMADTLQYRYKGSIFYKWSTTDTSWGRFWAYWSGPDSWNNKNRHGNAIIKLLARTVFAFTQDAWHFAQMVMLTAGQAAIAINLDLDIAGNAMVDFLLVIAGMKLLTGVVFEKCWNGLFISVALEKRARLNGPDTYSSTPSWKTSILAAYPTMARYINAVFVAMPFFVLTLGHQAGWLADWMVVVGVIGFIFGVFFLVRQLYKR